MDCLTCPTCNAPVQRDNKIRGTQCDYCKTNLSDLPHLDLWVLAGGDVNPHRLEETRAYRQSVYRMLADLKDAS